MAKVKSLTVEMKGDASGVTRAARGARRAIRGVAQGAKRAATSVVGIGAALAGVVAGAGVIKLGVDAAASVDKIGKLSKQLKITTTDVQVLSHVAELSGTSSDNLIKGFQRVTRTLGDAQRGGKAAIAAFDDIGLSVEDLTKLTPKLRFEAVIAGLAGIEDPARRAAIANQLLGREWQKLNPLIDEGASAFARAKKIYMDLDLGIGSLNQGVEDMNDAWTDTQAIGAALRDNVFARLAPEIGKVVEKVNEVIGAFIKANGGGQAVAAMFATNIVEGVRSAIRWFGSFSEAVGTLIDGVSALAGWLVKLGTLYGGIAAAAAQVGQGNFSAAGSVISGAASDFFSSSGDDDETKDNNRRQTDLLGQIVEELRGLNVGAAFQ